MRGLAIRFFGGLYLDLCTCACTCTTATMERCHSDIEKECELDLLLQYSSALRSQAVINFQTSIIIESCSLVPRPPAQEPGNKAMHHATVNIV